MSIRVATIAFILLFAPTAQVSARVRGTDEERGLFLSAPSQELLLYRKPVGGYTVSVRGERLIGHAYFLFDVTHPAGTPGPNTHVVATLRHLPGDPYESAQAPPDDVGRADGESDSDRVPDTRSPPADEVTRYVARFDPRGQRFVVDEVALQEGFYTVSMRIDGPLEEAEGSFSLDVYPRKPETGLGFRLINLAVPPLLLLALLLATRLRRWRLEKPAAT